MLKTVRYTFRKKKLKMKCGSFRFVLFVDAIASLNRSTSYGWFYGQFSWRVASNFTKLPLGKCFSLILFVQCKNSLIYLPTNTHRSLLTPESSFELNFLTKVFSQQLQKNNPFICNARSSSSLVPISPERQPFFIKNSFC